MSESDFTPDADTPDADTPADDTPADDQAVEPRRWMPKLGGASVGAAMVGFEAAVFRTIPPPIEVVENSRHDGPMVTGDGTMLTITMPDPPAPAKPEEPPPTDD